MLKDILFKPKWMHKSADVRARAVAALDDPRLAEALPELARNDPSSKVRLAALRRLNDMYHLMRQAVDDEDEGVRSYAYRTYRTMLAGAHDNAPPLDQRLEIVPRLDDDDMVEYLAQNAHDVQIRLAAVQRLEKAGLLGDIAIGDADHKVRMAAAERVSQTSTLERIQRAVRRTDKRLYREVSDRVEAATGQSRDASEVKAEALCQALDQLCRSDDPKDLRQEHLDQIVRDWDELDESIREPHKPHFNGARKIVVRSIEGPGADADAESAEIRALRLELNGLIDDARHVESIDSLGSVQALLERARKLLEQVDAQLGEEAHRRLEATIHRLEERSGQLLAAQPVPKPLLDLAENASQIKPRQATGRTIGDLQQQWDREWKRLLHPTANEEGVRARFHDALARLEEALGERAQQRETALARIGDEVTELEAALDDGDLTGAAAAQGKILKSLKTVGRHPDVDCTDFRARLASARGRLHELRDWQHWSNNQAREELCNQAEGLVGSGLHPDAVKEKVKALNAQWRDLNDKEKLPGDNPRRFPAPQLYRRFRAACDKAFAPAKEFFDKRAEVRAHNFDELTELAERIEAAAAAKSLDDVKALENLVRDGRRSLRRLDGIPPRQRGAMSKRLREAANAVDELLEDHYQIVERRKERIIEEVEALTPEADLEAAIEAAKAAQRRWKETGRTRRNRDQKLWKRFRAACDVVFTHLDDKRAEEKAEDAARNAKFDEILQSLESILAIEELTPETATSELRRLGDEWRQAGTPDRRRDQRYAELRKKVENRIDQQARARMLARRDQVRQLAVLCQRAEAAWFGDSVDRSTLESEWVDANAGHDVPADLARRFEASAGDPPGDIERLSQENLSIAQDLLVQLEFLAGVDTPEAFAKQRMDYQVRRLSERMSGQGDADPVSESAELERRWRRLGPIDPTRQAALNERYQGATAAIDQMA